MGNTASQRNQNAPPSRQVTTKYGSMIGKRLVSKGEKQVDAFLGVPFAKAPVGNLRFKPEPPDPWTGVKKAEEFGPRGMQKDTFFFTKWKYGETSEDNLYLNIFTPVWEPPPGGFPVMVFVHGGAFVSDSSVKYGDIGICTHMVPHGVVMVTIQYRLGYMGFFSTGSSACVDNLALWDMTAALRWINENIAAFAGNADNVTVFGQSAGGASVDLLSLSPHSRDLFHKVIPMAGNAACEWAINGDVVETCRKFAARIGVDELDDVELRQVEAAKFASSMRVGAGDISNNRTEIGPRIDGDFLSRSPSELRVDAPKKPTLVGTCQYEGLMFCKFSHFDCFSDLIAEKIPEERYLDFKALRAEALRLYIDPDKDRHDKNVHFQFYSDVFLNNGTQRFVLEQLEQNNENVYLYSFDYCNAESWGILGWIMPFKGATHCTELAYLFNVGIVMDFTFNDNDNKMLSIMTKLWTNFAKYGNPNGRDNDAEKFSFEWLPVDKDHPHRYLSIKLEPQMKANFHDGRPAFWANLKNRASKQQ
ncbi:unnamed protein product [Toxocara canis]|uniref:COesterase domain-containing protein n=1 Tax=Toxocara canis TaxID=6265 RepID=A0A183TV76_TOXCA|nr:unnamed protein product [Toxocara canis]